MNKLFLPGTFFVGTLILLLVYSQGNVKRKTATTQSGKVPYMQVHQYKQETAIKIGLEKDQANFRKYSEKSRLHHIANENNDFYDTGLTPEKNRAYEDIADESVQQAVTLDQKMDGFLAQRQRYEELETAKRKAYVDEFKRGALAMGYQVIIDRNMKIISVKKIKKNSKNK